MLAGSLVSAATDAATLYVSAVGAGTACSSSKPCALQHAFDTAVNSTEDNTITIAAGRYSSSTGYTYNPNFPDHNITITGAGRDSTFITAASGDVFTSAFSGTMTISGITVQNGTAKGINLISDFMSIHTIGTIFNVVIDDCSFSHNADSAILMSNGYFNGTITIQNSLFDHNAAISVDPTTGYGAGINIVTGGAQSDPVIVTNNLFDHNTSHNNGGAVYILTYDGTSAITLTGNTFQNNTDDGADFTAGGGAYVQTSSANSPITVTGNTFTDNTVLPASGGSGAIFARANASPVIFQGNTVTGNTAPSGEGGAVQMIFFDGAGEFSNNTIQDNSALYIGGFQISLQYLFGASPTFSMNANLVSGNTSTDNGGGTLEMYQLAAPAIITNNIFVGNTTPSGDANVGGFVITSTSSQTQDINLINNTFANNSSDGLGGGALVLGITSDITVNAYNNIFWNNTSASYPGNDLYIFNPTWIGMNFNNNDVTLICVDPGDGGRCNTGNDFSALVPYSVTVTSGLYNIDPLFVGTGIVIDAYGLQATSPMIAVGSSSAPSLPTYDYTGTVPLDTPPDLGGLQYCTPALSLTVTPPSGSILVGDTVTWTVTVPNSAGCGEENSSTLNLTFTNATFVTGTGTGVSCSGSGGAATCTISTVAEKGTATITVSTTVPAAGSFSLTADLTYSAGTATASGTGTASTTPQPPPSPAPVSFSSNGCALIKND